jgi:serine protease 16
MKSLLLIVSTLAFFHVKSFGEMRKLAIQNQKSDLTIVPLLEFEQIVDHFDKRNTNTYKQTYFVDDRHYKPGGPIILQLTGEWALSDIISDTRLENAMASRYGGLHVGLEHRFYGPDFSNRSLPTPDYTKESLKYLSADQALGDTANFIKNVQFVVNGTVVDTKTAKWIVVGASYAGNLSAWMRLKFPELVFGAHSSSAPYFAKADFWEYGYAVDVGVPKLGGTQTCSDNWVKAVKYFDDLVETKGPESVLNDFGVDKTMDIRDLAMFSSYFSTFIQYGDVLANWPDSPMIKLCSGKIVPSFANVTAEPAELYQGLISLFKLQYPTPEAVSTEFDMRLVAAQYPKIFPWYWQVCKEFGYWQVARKQDRTFFSRLITVDYFESLCELGYGKENSKPDPDAVNQKYLGNEFRFNTSRVVIVNGDLDPWSYLSVTDKDNLSPQNKVILIANGTHCDDMSVPEPFSPQPLKDAHAEIIKTWDLYLGFKG